jgi:hypothetical protein
MGYNYPHELSIEHLSLSLSLSLYIYIYIVKLENKLKRKIRLIIKLMVLELQKTKAHAPRKALPYLNKLHIYRIHSKWQIQNKKVKTQENKNKIYKREPKNISYPSCLPLEFNPLLFFFSSFHSCLMECSSTSWVFKFFFLLLIIPLGSSSSSLLQSLTINSTAMHRNHTVISEFRILNRKVFSDCPNLNPFLHISVSTHSNISDEEYVDVTVSGVLFPSKLDFVAMVSPAHSE